jgi:hypothetical protein
MGPPLGSTHGSHIKASALTTLSLAQVRFVDADANGEVLCKFVCNVFWSTQFHAFRCAFLGEDGAEDDLKYLKSLATSAKARPLDRGRGWKHEYWRRRG